MKEKSSKKKAIFDSTLDLVKDLGFHGTTMSLVSKNAGVAAGTIYHYFESKDQLICELYAYNRHRLVEIVDEAVVEDQTCQKNFFSIWRKLYQFYTDNTNVLIFFEQFVNSPYNQNKNHKHFQGQLYNFFSEGSEKGCMKSVKPEILVVLTMSSIAATAKLNRFGNIPLSDNDLSHIVEVLWDGIAKRAELET